jgi:hypothetical protein
LISKLFLHKDCKYEYLGDLFCVESGRFYMYQYMTREGERTGGAPTEKLIFFFIQENKHVIS